MSSLLVDVPGVLAVTGSERSALSTAGGDAGGVLAGLEQCMDAKDGAGPGEFGESLRQFGRVSAATVDGLDR